MKRLLRRVKHLGKSGCITSGIEHFLVMFPSALLVAQITSTALGGAVVELSAVLLACGLGNLAFLTITKGKIPFFLGPSFAYIGFTSYHVAMITSPNHIETVRSTIFWGYIIAAVLMLVISLCYRFEVVQKVINFLFPNVIMGPAISLIGLELADLAVEDAGLATKDRTQILLSMVTLTVTILASLTKRKFLKNSSVILGVMVGCVCATFLGVMDWSAVFTKTMVLKIPEIKINYLLKMPENFWQLFIAVLPCAIVAFVESLGRIEVLIGMQKRDKPIGQQINKQLPMRTLRAHGFANLCGIIGGVTPNAIYAENLAIMNLNNAELSTRERITEDADKFVVNCYALYSIYPYVIAAFLTLIIAFYGGLQGLFVAIPKAVLGGIELFVFSLIAAPGIQMLVEQKVNYKKVSNQIITASVLLAGVSNMSINLTTIELKGMSLGLIIGVVLNLLIKLLTFLGLLNERMSILEIIDECLDSFNGRVSLVMRGNSYYSGKKIPYSVEELKKNIRESATYEMIKAANAIELVSEKTSKIIAIQKEYDKITLQVSLEEIQRTTLCNDYKNIVPIEGANRVNVLVNEYFSSRKLKEIIKNTI